MSRPLLMLTCLLLGWTSLSFAHQPASSYILLQAQADEAGSKGSVLHLSWRVHVRDLATSVALDNNGDGAVNWLEVRQADARIRRFFQDSVRITAGSTVCSPSEPPPLALRTLYDGLYLSFDTPLDCIIAADAVIDVSASAFFTSDPLHRTIVSVSGPGWPSLQQVLASSEDEAEFETAADSATTADIFTTFIYQGIWHIAIGLDHILFVFALLLTVVLVKEGHSWRPARSNRAVFLQTLKLVTAFTVAHSITLSLSVLGLIQGSAVWVESIIALSVAVVALNNIRPILSDRLWAVTFIFGLIHGVGFASVLLDLGLPPEARGLALLAFNIGVECGQLLLVVLVLPLLLALRHWLPYRRWIMPVLSLMIALMAVYWIGERTGVMS
ncbi:HupE/UreJ family protein [Allohahella marinimesophila]|uniref:HupE/UreJ family protein n=1 Tax=Allohahella marinimesophila TaxID=1054972 RepID=A0ABP7PN50_9GAMM